LTRGLSIRPEAVGGDPAGGGRLDPAGGGQGRSGRRRSGPIRPEAVRADPAGGGQGPGLPDGLCRDGEADGLAERLVADARAVAGRLTEVLGLAVGLDETELVWDG
jgi:hypothetical protein